MTMLDYVLAIYDAIYRVIDAQCPLRADHIRTSMIDFVLSTVTPLVDDDKFMLTDDDFVQLMGQLASDLAHRFPALAQSMIACFDAVMGDKAQRTVAHVRWTALMIRIINRAK